MKNIVLMSLLLACTCALGQDAAQPQSEAAQQNQIVQSGSQPTADQAGSIKIEPMDQTPVFRVNVVSRTTKAVNYRHRGGSTMIDFKGTDLMPQATGKAKVDSKSGRLQINAEFSHLQAATKLGSEYLTYVLWAITPEGRPVN